MSRLARAREAGAVAALSLALLSAPRAAEAPVSLGASGSADRLGAARLQGFVTLRDCFDVAVVENERMGRAQEDTTQARLVKLAAWGAILPQVTLEDNYYRQNKVTLAAPTGGTGSAFSFADSRNQAFVRLKQTIFSGLRDRSFLSYSRSNIEAFEQRLEVARLALYGDVAQAFYAALQKEGEGQALEDSVRVERERFREIQARHEAGLARKTEVLLVQSQLAEDESKLTRSRNELELARQQLGFLMTAPLDLPLRDDLVVPEVLSASELEALVGEAANARSDLKALEKEMEAARYQIAVARGDYLPTISLEADAYLERQNYSTFAQATDWSAEIDFTFPLFDGGRIRSNVLTAQSRLRQATLDRDALLRQVRLDVQTALLTLQSDIAQLRTLETSVASADENDRLVQEEYRSGLATNLEVITGHNLLQSARLDLERQKYQVKLDWVALKLAQGLLPGDEPAAAPAANAPPGPGR